MGFRGAWNKRNNIVEDLETFLKLYKKAQKAYKKVRKVEFSNNDELIQNAKKRYQEIWDEYRAFINKKSLDRSKALVNHKKDESNR
jgi:small subunit ribosomal protein S19